MTLDELLAWHKDEGDSINAFGPKAVARAFHVECVKAIREAVEDRKTLAKAIHFSPAYLVDEDAFKTNHATAFKLAETYFGMEYRKSNAPEKPNRAQRRAAK